MNSRTLIAVLLVLLVELSGCGKAEEREMVHPDSGGRTGVVDAFDVVDVLPGETRLDGGLTDLSDAPGPREIAIPPETTPEETAVELVDVPADAPVPPDLVDQVDEDAPLPGDAGPDVPIICEPGERKCQDDQVLLLCSDGGTEWTETSCWDEGVGYVCSDDDCKLQCDLNPPTESYLGCEFSAVDLDNAFVPGGRSGYYDAAGAQYSLIVLNPHSWWPASITISDSDGPLPFDGDDPLPSGDIPPGEAQVYNLPRRDVDGTVVGSLAYQVVSNVPVSVYQFNPLENVDVFSNDASLLLPWSSAGKLYYVMTREQSFDALRSYFTVVGHQPDTVVTVTVTAKTLAGTNQLTGGPIAALAPGDTLEVKLGQFDVLNIETDEIGADLTGTLISATKPVAVFGGSEAANSPNTNHCIEGVCEWDGATPCAGPADCITAGFNTCCADHLEQQLLPVASWGDSYLAAKTYPRGQEKDVYRVIAATDGTEIITMPAQAPAFTLNAGEWAEFESDEDFVIGANNPIMVGQFIPAQDAPGPNINGIPQAGDAGIGDPAFILLVPTQQFRNDYGFVAPNKYQLDYVTIVAPADALVWFDCPYVAPQEIQENCSPMNASEFQSLGDGQYAAAKFVVTDGPHRIYADGPVGVYVYGYDQYVSYGYPAGLNTGDLGLFDQPGQ